jgi:hypothetical protein
LCKSIDADVQVCPPFPKLVIQIRGCSDPSRNNENIRFSKQTALALTKSKFKFVLLQRGIVQTFDSRAIIMQVAGAKSPILPLKKAKSQEMEKNHKIPQQWRLL